VHQGFSAGFIYPPADLRLFSSMSPKAATPKKKGVTKYTIDCSQQVKEKMINLEKFQLFLQERIKVDGKTGNLGNKIAVTCASGKITVAAEGAFSKRYLKYLTKKYLKKLEYRDFMRVVATNKTTYAVSFYNMPADEEDDE